MDRLCDLRRESEETRHIPLYVYGSEGIQVCHNCEMGLVDHCRELALKVLRRRKAGHIDRRQHD